VPGISYDGGYADYIIAPPEALVHIPDDISATEDAPMMCAGITTFNALRNSGARPGDVVAILGIGGLGHLGIQFSNKIGFKTIAIGRGKEKEQMAKNLEQYNTLTVQSKMLLKSFSNMEEATTMIIAMEKEPK